MSSQTRSDGNRSEMVRPSPIQTYSHGLLPRSARRRQGDTSNVPAFLQQDRTDIRAKWRMLEYLQRERLHEARAGPEDSRWKIDLSDIATSRNRYSNIHPWNGNRVKLNVPEEHCDYINASPILLDHKKEGSKRYIATQGPKRGQYNHLWRMVWQETKDVAVIVMLTKTLEQGRDKCFQYFPLKVDEDPWIIDGSEDIGDGFHATIRLLEKAKDRKAGCTVRKILLQVGEEEKIVWHLLFKGWPDFGVPEGYDKLALLEMIKLANSKNSGPENPIIVHCSAGVGRSGTWITLDYVLREMDKGNIKMDELEDPVYDTVNFLREQRMYMVQSEAQYHFIYSILKDRYLSIRKSASPPPSGRATPAPTEAAVEAVPPPLPPVEVGDATGALAGDETMTGTEPVAA